MAVTVLNAKPTNLVCKGVELFITDSVNYGFISKKEVLMLLERKKISPIGKNMQDINVRQLEKELKTLSLAENVECYKTCGGKIGIELKQRVPILRIMSNKGENYYIDNKGAIMPIIPTPVHVAIVTGDVDQHMARKQLYRLGNFLQNNPFWKAQVEQINVTPTKELEIVPLVGEHIIFLGKAENYEDKFERLKIFYEKALNVVGWNKYDRISLEFSNQIICTKKVK